MTSTATQQAEELLTAKEVAAILRVSQGWVYDHSRRGKAPTLPCISLGGTVLRFKRSEVSAFIEKWSGRA
jgi:excisionase family DNA binding protein